MSFQRKFEVSSLYYVPILALKEENGKVQEVKTSWEEDFLRIGFERDDKGLWIPPKDFSFSDLKSREKGTVRLSSDPIKWHKIYKYFSPPQVSGETSHVLIRVLFRESFKSYYGNYEFNLLTKIYPSLSLKKKERVYTKVLNTPLNTFDDWLVFPFKPRPILHLGSSEAGEAIHTLIDTKGKQSILKDYADKFISEELTYSDLEVLKEHFSEDYGIETPYEEVRINSESIEQNETYTFLSWDAFWFWELYEDIKNHFNLSKCKLCGSYIKGHKDKLFCDKEVNLNCWKEQQKIKKKKQRSRLQPKKS
ncbi:MAG: hypothetical protein WD187_02945 [Candidatus Woykebacteria bacterium]